MATKSDAAGLLLAQDYITILCHRSPDGDTLGSGYALCHGLRSLGKQARLICADPVPTNLGEILSVCEEQDWQEQFVVAVDVADSKLLGELAEQYGERVDLVVDHHFSNREYGKELWLDPDAAATAEMMTALLLEMGVTLTPEIATCLYTGIATDTGCFRYANTTANTLRTVATLVECGVDAAEINRRLFESKTRERVAVECAALGTLEYYCDGRCAVMTIRSSLLAEHGLGDDDIEGMSGLPRQIVGVWVGVTIREQPDHCRVSVRTTKEADASAICAGFGGGGHLRAGGCSMRGTVDEVKARLVAEIADQLGYKEYK